VDQVLGLPNLQHGDLPGVRNPSSEENIFKVLAIIICMCFKL